MTIERSAAHGASVSRRRLLHGGATGVAMCVLAVVSGRPSWATTSSTGQARKPPRIDNRPSPHHYQGRAGHTVTLLALHESAGVTDGHELAAVCERIGVSYHAIIDLDGLTYTVNRRNACFALPNGNWISDNLCLTSPGEGYSREEWLGPQRPKIDYASWWLATVAGKRHLDLIMCSDRNILDAAGGDKAAGGVTSHADWDRVTHDPTPHDDPRNFPFDVCLDQAQQLAGFTHY